MATILIVDDEQDMRNLIDVMLTKSGFKTFTAANGTEAYHVLMQEIVDLVLLDVMMPGKMALRCAKRFVVFQIPQLFS